jgi:fatty-acyl-CoA synthase
MKPPASKTLGTLIQEQAAARGDADGVVFGERRVSYRGLLEDVQRMARGFLALGLRPGDRIVAWLPNSVEWIVADLAAVSIGCVFVGGNTWYQARELHYVLKQSGARLLLVTDRFLRHDYEAQFAALGAVDDGTGTRGGRVVPSLPDLEFVVSFATGFSGATHTLGDVLAKGTRVSAAAWENAAAAVDPEAPAYLLYTSGSTAAPKGVILRHRGLIENGFNIGERQHLEAADRMWLASPLFFSYGCANGLMAQLTHGVTLVLQDHFDGPAAFRTLVDERCTVYYASAQMTMALLDLPDGERARLRLRTGTAAGAQATVRAVIERLGVTQACNMFGLTETYGNCTVTDAMEPPEVRWSGSGPALPGTEIRIVDPETGKPQNADEVGEIRVRGYVTPGYYDDAERNAAAFDADGFLKTGDLGYLDRRAHLHWVARMDDMIKASGMNVAPVEVELVLNADPRVKRAYVVGIPDKQRGQVVGAFLELEGGQQMRDSDVRDVCAAELASYKVPRVVEFLRHEDVPFTPTGKVRKRDLRDRYVAKTAEA